MKGVLLMRGTFNFICTKMLENPRVLKTDDIIIIIKCSRIHTAIGEALRVLSALLTQLFVYIHTAACLEGKNGQNTSSLQ